MEDGDLPIIPNILCLDNLVPHAKLQFTGNQ